MASILRRPAVLLALCLCSVGAVVTLLGRLATGPAVAMKLVDFANEPGAKAYPAFSPDGSRLAYSGRGNQAKDDTFHIFVKDVAGGTPRQLTSGASNDVSPAWSPDGGRIAFVRITDPGSECVIISSSGSGDERKISGCSAPGDETQPQAALSWSRDGRSLVIVQSSEKQPAALAILNIDSGTIQTISHPPAGSEGDSSPAVSPDGNSIAFVRGTNNDGADIFLCDASGANPRRLTFDDRAIRGLSWSRDGQDLVYSGTRAGGWRIWRVQAYGGSPHDFMLAGRNARYAAVAPAGSHMVYTESPAVSSIWRTTIGGENAGPGHVVIRSSGKESCPRFSPDGKRIADISDQTGNDEIWIADADGSNRVQVTTLKGPDLNRLRWSHDGKLLIFDADSDHGTDLYTIPAAAHGKMTRVAASASNGSFSHDGKSIYYQSRGQIWKANLDGGNPEQLTKMSGGAQPVESADGKTVYFRARRTFMSVPSEGGRETEAFSPDYDLIWSSTIQLVPEGIYYLEFERSARAMALGFFNFATKKSDIVYHFAPGQFDQSNFAVSPDQKSLLYPRVDQSQTNLKLVQNFR